MAILIDGIVTTDVYCFFKNTNYNISNNIYYRKDNWVKKINLKFGCILAINDKINVIRSEGGVIWLTSNGETYYRFSPFGKVHTASITYNYRRFHETLDYKKPMNVYFNNLKINKEIVDINDKHVA